MAGGVVDAETVSLLRGPNGDDARAVCRVFASRDEALEQAAEYNVDDGEGVWTVETWQVKTPEPEEGISRRALMTEAGK